MIMLLLIMCYDYVLYNILVKSVSLEVNICSFTLQFFHEVWISFDKMEFFRYFEKHFAIFSLYKMGSLESYTLKRVFT